MKPDFEFLGGVQRTLRTLVPMYARAELLVDVSMVDPLLLSLSIPLMELLILELIQDQAMAMMMISLSFGVVQLEMSFSS